MKITTRFQLNKTDIAKLIEDKYNVTNCKVRISHVSDDRSGLIVYSIEAKANKNDNII